MSVILKFSAFSNITYDYEHDTGYTREEWEALTDAERAEEMTNAIWEDMDAWDEDGPEEDCDLTGIQYIIA